MLTVCSGLEMVMVSVGWGVCVVVVVMGCSCFLLIRGGGGGGEGEREWFGLGMDHNSGIDRILLCCSKGTDTLFSSARNPALSEVFSC